MRRVMVLVAGLLLGIGLCLPGAAVAGEGCPNEQLRAENNSLGLPDCRAFEMVTPADKNSARVERVGEPTVAADGSSLVGKSPEGFAGLSSDELRLSEDANYRFIRTAAGWATTPLDPYRGLLMSIGVGGSDSVWGPAEGTSVARLRMRAADGSLSEIGPVWPSSLGQNKNVEPFSVVGVAAEALNGIVFTIREPGLLWPFDSTIGKNSLYEYTGTGNTSPSLVGVSGGVDSTALISRCGTLRGDGGYDIAEEGRNAVSENGGTVFFTAVGADSVDCGGVQPPVNELFARINEERTVAISEPSAADCALCDTGVPVSAAFQGASADGSKVFFTTMQPLLGKDTSENLYEYDFDAAVGQRVVRVSGGDGSVSEPTAEVQSVPYVSEDGSHVYFYAKGVLTTAANSTDEHAQAGGENLYMYERDAEYPAGRTAFITACGDASNGQVTPNGRFLAFTSGCHLTAEDTSTGRQVFQYDAKTGSLVRVSIGLEGYDDNGNATSGLNARIVSQGEGAGSGAPRGGALARTMSDDGSFVFFQSPVALTPQATNGGVYEYHEGRVSLIAAGGELIGTSASGRDVFFRTTQQLVGEDTDAQWDFYDARVDGGFLAPVGAAGCIGDACQGSPEAPPMFGAPSSAAFTGGGNVSSPGSTAVVVGSRALTRAQKFSRALKVCSRQPRRRRHACEAKAKRLYGHTSRVVKSDRRSK